MWSLHYNYVSPIYRSLCRFLPGTTLHTILEQNIKIHNSHCCCAHTLHTPLPYARMHLSSYIHVHTHALIKGVLNQGQSPQRTPLLQAHLLHTCIYTINITTAMVFLRPPPVSHQSVITTSQLLEQSACHTTAKYWRMHTHTHAHTTATVHAHTSHSTLTCTH